MTKLEAWLDASKICLDMRRLLVLVIDQWRSGEGIMGLATFDFDGVHGLFTSQK